MRWVLLMAALPAIAGDGAELVERVRRHASEILSRLPDYTCRMTVERTARPSDSRKWRPVDKLRLDVAYVGGKELFAWPGASNFEDKSLREIVGRGAMSSTGDFAMHLRAIFVDQGAEITCRDGDPIQCDYRVPLARSKYFILLDEGRGVAAYHGTFTVEPATLDLQRLDVHVGEIRPVLPVRSATKVIEYVRIPIGDSTFLLPRLTELEMDAQGGVSRNVTRFDACHQYAGASTISFGDPSEISPDGQPQVLELPAGVSIETALKTTVTTDSAIGDPLIAVVTKAVKRDGFELLPRGARLVGRLTRLQRGWSGRIEYRVVGVLFNAVERPGARGALRASLISVGVGPNYQVLVSDKPAIHGESIFSVRGPTPSIASLRMTWRTQ